MAAENAADDNGGGGPRCIFDERISTLRCRDEGDFRRITSSIEQLAEEISVRIELFIYQLLNLICSSTK